MCNKASAPKGAFFVSSIAPGLAGGSAALSRFHRFPRELPLSCQGRWEIFFDAKDASGNRSETGYAEVLVDAAALSAVVGVIGAQPINIMAATAATDILPERVGILGMAHLLSGVEKEDAGE